jgi:aminobenzoyl-glutamate utilization protein B
MTATEVNGSNAHSWQYVACGKSDMAHKATLYAAKAMAGTAIDLFESPETIEAAKAELNKRLGGGKYVSPMAPEVKPRAIAPKK